MKKTTDFDMNTDIFNYNYVIFNYYDDPNRVMEDGYYSICLKDLESLDNVQIVSFPLDKKSKFIRFFYRLHHSYKLNKIIKLPMKKIWYPLYFNKKYFKNNKPICFISIGPYITIDYIKYLKKKYRDAKFVKLHRDLVKVYQRGSPEWTEENLRKYYDLWMSYDKNEAMEKGMLHFNEFESKIEIEPDIKNVKTDLFFAGAAKNRLDKIMAVYERFVSLGKTCDFYLVGVDQSQQVKKSGIVYADKFLPYKEVLQRSVNSNCILEINQQGAIGYTARFLEAVIYNKKLITNNQSIKESKFYNPKFIKCFTDVEEIDQDFILDDVNVDYKYNNEFSPVNLLMQIEKELAKL